MSSRIFRIAALAALFPTALPAQKPGDTVTPAALAKLDWIQGEAPAEWEAGKVYLLECWATWCGPCIAAIPHVDDLHDRFHDKGLRVLGINVWEDGRDKVAAFVARKGEGMSYPVAYTGKGGPFETEWLKPAGVTGIPSAFVVKDGKVVVRTHPSRIDDAFIGALLEGGDAERAALAAIAEADQRQAAARSIGSDLRKAMASKDKARIHALLEELEKADPASTALPPMRVMALAACDEWDEARAAYDQLPAGSARQTLAFNMFMMPSRTQGMPDNFKAALADDYEPAVPRLKGNYAWIRLARIRWEVGQKDRAVEAAKRALEEAADATSPYSETACRKLVESLEAGTMPDEPTLRKWSVAGEPEE